MTMPAEFAIILKGDDRARNIGQLWSRYNNQRKEKIAEWKELRNYLFATDTSTTSNQVLPWKNSTTLPKLTQIRDNLHSNYLSALFPNDQWLRWEGYSREDVIQQKREAITQYMATKCRQGNFRTVSSRLLYDYIDYGNAFSTVSFESSYKENALGEKVPNYIGPRLHRISPMDIVFNPLAESFQDSFKIVRSIKTIGELKKMSLIEPDNVYLVDALKRRELLADTFSSMTTDDWDKAEGLQVDGFGSLQEYYTSGSVEILEFYGDLHDAKTGRLEENKIITIIDRATVIRDADIPSWLGHAPIYHVGWRMRPDNLWAMGPLDNLVGMQYRIDHLENIKADAHDLGVHPPLLIKGEVEEFEYGPGAEIHIDEQGDVTELARNVQWILSADSQIVALEQRMENFAGAPAQAMGIRTPGEKTAFEVQSLDNAAGRIFQEKITHFEIESLEPSLNAMLETSRRNLEGSAIIQVLDDVTQRSKFMEITKADIVANGLLRPIGARHFAENAQLIQNLTATFASPLGQMMAPHTSAIQMTKVIEDVLNLKAYKLFTPNIAVQEQKETQSSMNQAGEDLEAESLTEIPQ